MNYKDENSDFIMNIKNWGCLRDKQYKYLFGEYIANANVIIFVYDITNVESFNNLADYIEEVKAEAGKSAEGCLFFLLGNKLDLVEQNQNARQVELENAQELAEEKGLTFLGECSAKDNIYVPDQDDLYCKQKGLVEYGKCKEGLSGMLKDIIFSIYKHK